MTIHQFRLGDGAKVKAGQACSAIVVDCWIVFVLGRSGVGCWSRRWRRSRKGAELLDGAIVFVQLEEGMEDEEIGDGAVEYSWDFGTAISTA
jgi:hypothetical protein